MPDSRGSRFALEVLFLIALAGALALADLRPIEIAGVMLVGWVIVAALEWAAWRGQPHGRTPLPTSRRVGALRERCAPPRAACIVCFAPRYPANYPANLPMRRR